VTIIAPVVVTWLSTSRSGLSAPSSRKMRLPPPTTTGSIPLELVDKVVLDQRQRGHGRGDLTLEHHRVLPLERLGRPCGVRVGG
jgi:hypothetical protein